MKYKEGLKVVLEDALAGAGDGVWGNAPVDTTTGDMQGDELFAPGDARMVYGNKPASSKSKKSKKKKRKDTNMIAPVYRRAFTESVEDAAQILEGVIISTSEYLDVATKALKASGVDYCTERDHITFRGYEEDILYAVDVCSKAITEEVFADNVLVLLGELNLDLHKSKNNNTPKQKAQRRLERKTASKHNTTKIPKRRKGCIVS